MQSLGVTLSAAIPASAQQIWEATLGQLVLKVTRQNYDTWLRPTVGLRYEGTTLVVRAANELACDWLSTRMKSVIAQALTTVAGAGLSVQFEPADEGVKTDPSTPLQPRLIQNQRTPLNPRFSFNTFVEAPFNQLAVTAARDVASNLSSQYSPLFISGNSGLGKTHLLHAIAHHAQSAGQAFLLVTAEQFLSEFTSALRAKTGAAFRARYREPELLLVDDVHTLTGKKATLQEFYQTISCLHDEGKRVVVAGDLTAMAAEITRFKTVLRWGLVAQIDSPPPEDRIRLVDFKARAQGMELAPEVQHYLALRVRTSVRELEGAVNRVSALSRISAEPLTIDFAARALRPPAASLEDEDPVSPTQLIEAVAQHLQLPPGDITGQKRARALTYARHLAMYLLRNDASMTYTAIARVMNKEDHSTVVHACSNLLHRLTVSPELRADIDAIRAMLHSPQSAA
jgi:chromosomal replication initiator protein